MEKSKENMMPSSYEKLIKEKIPIFFESKIHKAIIWFLPSKFRDTPLIIREDIYGAITVNYTNLDELKNFIKELEEEMFNKITKENFLEKIPLKLIMELGFGTVWLLPSGFPYCILLAYEDGSEDMGAEILRLTDPATVERINKMLKGADKIIKYERGKGI